MGDNQFQPWLRLAGETDSHWGWFVAYRDAGSARAIPAVAKKFGVSHSAVLRASNEHDWRARCHAWDAEVDKARRELFLAKQREAIDAHARVGRRLRKLAAEALTDPKAKARIRANPKLAIELLRTAVKMEQQSLGMPTEITALALKDGKPLDTSDIYFDKIPQDKLIPLIEISLKTLKAQKEAEAIANDRQIE